jgi:LCP family protein required for cell wall assembly
MPSDENQPPAPRGPRHAAPRHAAPRRRPDAKGDGQATSRSGGTRRGFRLWPGNRWARLGLTITIVLALIIGSYAGYVWYEASKINRISVGNLSGGTANGAAAGTENILMVGSTSRCDLKKQNPIFGLCSQGVTGVNSDVVMVLHLDPNAKRVSILSIPRDTFIPNARKDGANKIDAALAEGPGQLVKAVQEDFGIPIQHFVELNFETFAGVVDALGGVDMYFPKRVHDAYSQLKQYHIGCNHLDGFAALTVVRARHLQYQPDDSYGPNVANWSQEPQSDLARIRRNHEFLRVLASAVSAKGIGDPITDAKLVAAVAPQLTVDAGFSNSHMVDLISTYHGVDSQTAPQYTLPVMSSNSYSYIYKGYNYGNVAFPDLSPDLDTIQAFLGVNSDTNTMDGSQLPRPSAVTVAVMNGSGVAGQATSTATSLKALGYKVSNVGDVTPVGPISETLVAYNSKNPKVLAQAQRVLRSISGQAILAYQPENADPVTLITGSYFSVDSPAPKATTTTKPKAPAKGATTTTTVPPTTTTTTVPGFAATIAPTSGLEAWDPRSCTPSGGMGP